jgi:competence protein ComEC
MCDVGQGSAVLLNAAPGAAVLVDAGPDPPLVDRCLAEAGIGTIPVVLLTHYHRDHVGGLGGALRGRSVGAVLATAIRDPPEQAGQVDAAMAELGLSVVPVAAGDSRAAGSVAWRTLWPRRALGDGPNNASLVVVASVDGHLVLLPGDIERAAQVAVLPDLPDVDVALVPHHGSADLQPGFAAATRAEIALLSVGAENPFGHPAPEAVAEWSGALLARTDLHGDVAVVADDQGLWVVVRRGMLPPWQPG